MRSLVSISLTCGLLLATTVRAEDSEAAKVIDKALKAHGNPSAKQAAVVWKGKGTFYGMGDGFPYTGTWSIQSADKFKIEIDNVFSLIVNGDKGWFGDQEMTKEQLEENRQGMHQNYVARLYPLKDKAFALKLVGEGKVDDKPAVGVKVSSKGRRDVTLYFDKESGLLVKMEMQVKDEQSGEEKKQESFIKDYVTVDGVKLPSKMVIKRDGKVYVDGEMTEYKTSEKLPDETFAKPK